MFYVQNASMEKAIDKITVVKREGDETCNFSFCVWCNRKGSATEGHRGGQRRGVVHLTDCNNDVTEPI